MSERTTSEKRPIVVGVDGSETAIEALRRSAEFAAALGAEVVVVFVRHLPPVVADPTAGEAVAVLSDSLDELERSIRATTSEMLAGTGVGWSFETRHGDPAHELISAAREHAATLVVVGSPCHGAVASLVLSSVAAHLLHHCEISLAVIRPER